MLKGDPALPFLEMAWSRPAFEAFFKENVLPMLFPGQHLAATKQLRTRYRAGKRCVNLYSVWLGTTESQRPRLVTTTFGRASWFEQTLRHRDRLSGAAGATTLLLPEFRCLVEFFPEDYELPGLAPATDPTRMSAELSELASGGSASAPSSRVEIGVLRYVPHRRCVLHYVIDSAEGPRHLIGKVYSQDGKAAQVYEKLDAVRRQLSTARAAGIVPVPVGVVGEWNLVVMERVPGTSLAQMLRSATSNGAVEEAILLAARTLAALHSVHLESAEVHSLAGELELVRKRGSRLHLVAPALGERLDSVLGQVAPLAQGLPCAEPAFIHDGYKPSQILIEGDRASLVDFDGSAVGDPAIDVGKFMAQLRKEALLSGRDEIRELSDRFVTEYEARSATNGLRERARIGECIALAQIAIQRFGARPYAYARDGEASLPALALREAAACLATL